MYKKTVRFHWLLIFGPNITGYVQGTRRMDEGNQGWLGAMHWRTLWNTMMVYKLIDTYTVPADIEIDASKANSLYDGTNFLMHLLFTRFIVSY